MTTRMQVVEEARTWLGTRYHHQASLKNVGCDCVGLGFGVAVALGFLPENFKSLPQYSHCVSYSVQPNNGLLIKLCDKMLDRIELGTQQPGDILVLRFETEPQHIAIMTDHGIIHSFMQARKVVEHSMDKVWLSRVVAAYSFRGIK